jgi:iron-sulfur cluster assembly protein
MQEDGFDAATDYVECEKRWMPGLSYDLKFDKTKGENDKISDNDNYCCKKKSFLYLAGTVLEFSGGINGKGFVFNNPNATRKHVVVESFSFNFKDLKNLKN